MGASPEKKYARLHVEVASLLNNERILDLSILYILFYCVILYRFLFKSGISNTM